MAYINEVLKSVILPTALIIGTSGAFLMSSGQSRAEKPAAAATKACPQPSAISAEKGAKPSGTHYDVKKVEGTGARTAAPACDHAINTKGTGAAGRAKGGPGGGAQDCDDGDAACKHAINTKGAGASGRAAPGEDQDCDDLKDGEAEACRMAINEKGVPGKKKPKPDHKH
ncbi:MAG TPA: hypothetical protein VD929_11630 [Caulobacteraceae bacterium]|nr:hypothetical protein [Caulobacteraceae bacterium]